MQFEQLCKSPSIAYPSVLLGHLWPFSLYNETNRINAKAARKFFGVWGVRIHTSLQRTCWFGVREVSLNTMTRWSTERRLWIKKRLNLTALKAVQREMNVDLHTSNAAFWQTPLTRIVFSNLVQVSSPAHCRVLLTSFILCRNGVDS